MRLKFVFSVYLLGLIAAGMILTGGPLFDASVNPKAVAQCQEDDSIYTHYEEVKQTFLKSKSESDGASWTDFPVIAHALGSVDHKRAMNSVEGLAVNYTDNHMRIFETDLILTSDDKIVNRHDWFSYLYGEFEQSSEEGRKSIPLTYNEFMNLSIHKRYNPIDLETTAKVMSHHKDIYIITDTKYTDRETIAKQFKILVDTVKKVDPSVLNRLIIQIYNHKMYDEVMSIYPFKNLIYSVYANMDSQDDVIAYCKVKNIGTVAIPVEKASQEYIQKLRSQNIRVIIHIVNTEKEKEAYMGMGASAIFSDYLIQ